MTQQDKVLTFKSRLNVIRLPADIDVISSNNT